MSKETEKDFAKCLCDLSITIYTDFTKTIKDMCIQSAKEGNIHLILEQEKLNSIKFPISEYNLKTLRTFLEQEGLVVKIDVGAVEHAFVKEARIELFWIDLVIDKVVQKSSWRDPLNNVDISTKFPSISDQEVRRLLTTENGLRTFAKPESKPKESKVIPVAVEAKFRKEDRINKMRALYDHVIYNDEIDEIDNDELIFSDHADHISDDSDQDLIESDDNVFDIVITTDQIEKINDVVNYVKNQIEKSNTTTNWREKERIIYTMFLTLLKLENEDPDKNNKLFAFKTVIDNLIDKLNELTISQKLNWSTQMMAEFEEIKRKRFPND